MKVRLYILVAKMIYTTYHPHDLSQHEVHDYDKNMLDAIHYFLSQVMAFELAWETAEATTFWN